MKTTIEKSQKVADKINPIFALIEQLDDEDIDYLQESTKLIDEDQDRLKSVAGILVDLDKADAKIELGNQAKDRVTGIILIWSAIKSVPEIAMKYRKKALENNNLNKIFGL